MRIIKITSALVAAATVVAACGHIAVYDSTDSTRRNVGLEVYPPRPYIMVARTKAKERPTEVSVVYLPDLARPRYVHLQPGFIGSSKLTVAVSNGMVTSLGADSSSGVSELLTAYGGLATSLANAAKTEAETGVINDSREQGADTELLVTALQGVRTDLDDIIRQHPRPPTMLTNEYVDITRADTGLRATLEKVIKDLDADDSGPNRNAIRVRIETLANNWDEQIPDPEDSQPRERRALLSHLQSLRAQLVLIAGRTGTPEAPRPEFTLFEIIMVEGVDGQPSTTTLREVTSETTLQAALNQSQLAGAR